MTRQKDSGDKAIAQSGGEALGRESLGSESLEGIALPDTVGGGVKAAGRRKSSRRSTGKRNAAGKAALVAVCAEDAAIPSEDEPEGRQADTAQGRTSGEEQHDNDSAKEDARADIKPTVAQREAVLALVAQLPALPGVYRFLDGARQVLYVGKARNLKNRVSSYFHQNHTGTRIGLMVARIAFLETTTVRTEAEALLLENNLIKTLNPRFNILFRDDKSYPYLRISNHAYPRISYFRGAVNKQHHYYGPFPNAWAVRESIQLLQKLFKLRTCEDTVFSHRDRPCLLYQIKRCSGPCVQQVSHADYIADVRSAQEFLDGDADVVMGQLQARMRVHAQKLEFEAAAQVRDQLSALAGVLQHQAVEANTATQTDREVDIIAVKVQGGKACVNLAMVRGGRHLGDRAYFPTHVEDGAALRLAQQAELDERADEGADENENENTDTARVSARDAGQADVMDDAGADANLESSPGDMESAKDGVGTKVVPMLAAESAVLEAFIAQHYMALTLPAALVVSHPVSADLVLSLQEQAGRRVQVVTHPRGQRRVWLTMAEQGAALSLTRLLSQEGAQRERTLALVRALGLAVEPVEALRAECFDISHTAGEATMASCVVFEENRMQPSQYRRYNIRGVTPGDDYAAMRQVLLRRYGKIAEAMAQQSERVFAQAAGQEGAQEDESLAQIEATVNAQVLDASRGHMAVEDAATKRAAAQEEKAHDAGEAASQRAQSRAVAAKEVMDKEVRMPDLVLVDGGKGQVAMAREVFEQLGLDLSCIVGVEKGEGRKVGLEELVFADGRPKVYLGHDSAALMLVAEIRDEAHRFAITGMRAQRAKVRTGASRLEDIAGIGPKRRARLLQRFGGVRGVAAASIEELETVEGISHELANEIYAALR